MPLTWEEGEQNIDKILFARAPPVQSYFMAKKHVKFSIYFQTYSALCSAAVPHPPPPHIR